MHIIYNFVATYQASKWQLLMNGVHIQKSAITCFIISIIQGGPVNQKIVSSNLWSLVKWWWLEKERDRGAPALVTAHKHHIFILTFEYSVEHCCVFLQALWSQNKQPEWSKTPFNWRTFFAAKYLWIDPTWVQHFGFPQVTYFEWNHNICL